MLKHAHNHPVPPSTKVSREGREKYEEAVRTAGLRGITVGKTDRGKAIPISFFILQPLKSCRRSLAESTRKILGGRDPASFDPALANTR